MNKDVKLTDGRNATLAADHAMSSYGQPVLVIGGVAYNPRDTIMRGIWVSPEEAGPLVDMWRNGVSLAIMTMGMKLTCLRCGNQWVPRTMGIPGECPLCGSSVWRTPRTGNEPGPKSKKTR